MSMRLSKFAWTPGAVWKSTNERGELEAIIMGPDKNGVKNYLQVQMTYLTGIHSVINKPIQGSYSKTHMKKYFSYTKLQAEVPTEI